MCNSEQNWLTEARKNAVVKTVWPERERKYLFCSGLTCIGKVVIFPCKNSGRVGVSRGYARVFTRAACCESCECGGRSVSTLQEHVRFNMLVRPRSCIHTRRQFAPKPFCLLGGEVKERFLVRELQSGSHDAHCRMGIRPQQSVADFVGYHLS